MKRTAEKKKQQKKDEADALARVRKQIEEDRKNRSKVFNAEQEAAEKEKQEKLAAQKGKKM